MVSATSSSRAYRLEVSLPNDVGIQFDVKPSSTVTEVMEVVCKHWLNTDIRPGDGSINKHSWRTYRYGNDDGSGPESPLDPRMGHLARDLGWDGKQDIYEWWESAQREKRADNDEEGSRETYEDFVFKINACLAATTTEEMIAFLEAEERFLIESKEYEEGIPTTKTLEELASETPGFHLYVKYDYDAETNFKIRLVSVQDPVTTTLSRVLPSVAEEAAKTLVPYHPPSNLRNINEIYPLANDIMFKSGTARWVCPYPTRKTSAGFVEGGDDHCSEIISLVVPSFSGLHEALVAMDQAMLHYPASKCNATRVIFPVHMDDEGEQHFEDHRLTFQKFLQVQKTDSYKDLIEEMLLTSHPELRDDESLFESVLNEMLKDDLLCESDIHEVLRLSKDDVKNYDDVLEKAFPLCTKAYHDGLWAMFRHGKVIVAKGDDTENDRGIPRKILAQVKPQQGINSLHDFFCVCEALFDQAYTNEAYEVLLEGPAKIDALAKI